MPAAVRPNASHCIPVALFVALASLVLSGCSDDSPQALASQAQAEMAKGDHRSAVVQLKRALQLDPAAKQPRCDLGTSLLKLGDGASAAIEIGKCLADGGDRNRYLPELAEALVASGAWKKLTIEHGATQLDDPKAQARLKTQVALAWDLLRDRTKAEAALAAALASDANDLGALTLKARMAAGRGEMDAALAVVDRIIGIDPKRKEAWVIKGEVLGFGRNDVKAATDAFEKALAIDPGLIPAHVHLVGLKSNANDLSGARAQMERLKAAHPNNPQTHFVEAYVAAKQKDFTLAREKVQAVLKLLPDHVSVLQLAGAIEGESGSMVMAENHYLKALSLDPGLGNARINAARAQMRLGKPGKALETIKPLVGPDSQELEALGIAGEASLALGDALGSERFYRRAATVAPSDTFALTALAKARLARGEASDALASLRKLSETSKDLYADLALFSAHVRRGELQPAGDVLESIRRKEPESARVHELKGRLAMAAGDLAAAREAFDKLAVAEPRSFVALGKLVELDRAEQKPEAAEARLKQALKDQPGNVEAHLLLASLRESRQAPIEELQGLLTAAIQAVPTDVQLRVRLVDTNLRARKVSDALSAAQAAVSALPETVDLLDALGRAQALAGQSQQALVSFRKAATLDGRLSQPHMRMAMVHREMGNMQAAITSLQRAVELDPSEAQARADLLAAYARTKEADGAMRFAKELQAKAPQSEAGYLLEAAAQTRAKNTNGTISALKQGLAKADRPIEVARQYFRVLIDARREAEAERFAMDWVRKVPDDAGMHFELAGRAIVRKDYTAAEQHLRQSLALRGDHPITLNNLAWVLTVTRKPGALPFIQRALELMPGAPMLLDTLASVHLVEKRPAAALAALKQAVAAAPEQPLYRLNLADLALQVGDKATAKAELDHLAAIGARFPQQARVKELQRQL